MTALPPNRPRAAPAPQLGLRENWPQFTLLVAITAFVGAMVGLERAVLPLIASAEMNVASTSAVLAFVASFGLSKALANLAAGRLADRFERRQILLAGWVLALPVAPLILWAPRWSWIVAANALLGVSQGLTWSLAVIMKIDLAGPKRRGFAMGLNESAGYVALGFAGLASGFMAANFGLREGIAYPALAVACAGSLLSWFARDTTLHAAAEVDATSRKAGEAVTRSVGSDGSSVQFTPGNVGRSESARDRSRPRTSEILRRSMGTDPNLFAVSQAGMVNNLNDGVAWGLFPLLFVSTGFSVSETGILAAAYPLTWGVLQLGAGPLSDAVGRRPPIVTGMVLQGAALMAVTFADTFVSMMIALVALGAGTALVYPTLLAVVGDESHPSWRATAIGVYRLWRDLGYVAGAVLAGLLADMFGFRASVAAVGALTLFSGALFVARYSPGPDPAGNRELSDGIDLAHSGTSKKAAPLAPQG